MNCFFLHCHPISYIMIHVCNQKIDKHSEITKYGNFQTSPYQKLKSNFRVLHFIPISLALMWYTKIRKDKNKLSIIDLTSTSQSDHILDENSLQSVVNMSQSYFLCDRKSWKFSWKKLFFLHCLPISYFIIHVCNQKKINEHSKKTESWNFQTSPYHKLKSNCRVLHLIPIFLGLMCYTKIRKDENNLSIIDLILYSQSDHVLGENSLQSLVNMSQSYFLCDRKSWKFSWNELFFPSLPSYFLFYYTCLQSKNQ